MSARRLLIVEDELLIATDIEISLGRAGYQIVGVAGDYDQALSMAESTRPDLIIMDIALRGRKNGIEAAAAIREHWQIPVVFLTANADKVTLAAARSAGPYGFLIKPFRTDELTEAVRIAIEQHQHAEKLFTSYQWITTVLDSLTDAVIATDANAKVRFLNPAAESLTGWTPQEAAGRSIEEVYPLTDATGVALKDCLLKKALATGQYFGKSRLFLRTRAGACIPIEDSAAPILEHGRISGAVTIFLDISKRLEEEQRQEVEKDRLEEQVHSATEALGQTRAELRAFAGNLMLTQEQDQQRIARELHDDLGQQAAYMGMVLDRAADNGEAAGESLQELRALAKQLSAGLRDVSHRVHPTIIEDLGLSAALASLVDQENTGHNISFTERNVPLDVPSKTATALYRIVQEGLRNAARHAPGAAVRVSLSAVQNELELRIQDDGLGFSPVQAKGTGALGLVSMQERARLAGGNLLLSTRPGAGTVLLVRVPLGD